MHFHVRREWHSSYIKLTLHCISVGSLLMGTMNRLEIELLSFSLHCC